MQYLARQRNEETEAWWAHAIADEQLPIIVRELLGERQVMASPDEVEATLAWARSLPGWSERHPPLLALDLLP